MLVSFTGTWMQGVAQSWLIYRLSGSAWRLGLAGFASQVPVFLLAPLGGMMADRHSRHRIIIITQTVAMFQAFALAALTMSGVVTVKAVFALAVLLGIMSRDHTGSTDGTAFSHLREGFDYVRCTRLVRALLLLVAFVSIFGLPYIVLMRVWRRLEACSSAP